MNDYKLGDTIMARVVPVFEPDPVQLTKKGKPRKRQRIVRHPFPTQYYEIVLKTQEMVDRWNNVPCRS